MKVLFVCLGNICRSPTAEGVFKALVHEKNLNDRIKCDSAGTSAHHEGSPADGRSMNHAELRGYKLTSISRQITANDFFEFDLILTMDDSNYAKVIAMAKDIQADQNKVKKFTDYCVIHDIDHVPDPYHRGHDGFEHVLDIIEDGCTELLRQLQVCYHK